MLKWILFFLFYSVTSHTLGQEVAHFFIGQEAFSDHHVYTILKEEESEILYVGTNRGLFKYKNGQFEEIRGPKNQIGQSIFSLAKDAQNRVYCTNNSNQVYRVFDDHFEVIAQIPDEHLGGLLTFDFTRKNKLVILSSALLILDDKKRVKVLISKQQLSSTFLTTSLTFSRNWEDELLLNVKADMDTIISIRDGQTTDEVQVNYQHYKKTLKKTDYLQFATTGVIELATNEVPTEIQFNGQKHIFNSTGRTAYHSLSTDRFLLRSNTKGIVIFQANPALEKGLEKSAVCFKERFISTCFESKDGTLYLGTFNDGIIVVPSLSIQKFYTERRNFDITVGTNDLVHFTSEDELWEIRKGQIKQVDSLIGKGAKIQHLSGHIRLGNWNFNKNVFYQRKDQPNVADKTIIYLNNNQLITGAHNGLYFLTRKNTDQQMANNLLIDVQDPDWNRYLINDGTRIISQSYDSINSRIAYSTPVYVKVRKGINGEEYQLRFQEQQFSSNNMFFEKDILFCATFRHGILAFKNEQCVFSLNKKDGLYSNKVLKLRKSGNLLFIRSYEGLQIYDLNAKIFLYIGKQEGVDFDNIVDFDISENYLWVLERNAVQKIPITSITANTWVPKLYWEKILVNNRPVSNRSTFSCNYWENNWIFQIDFRNELLNDEVDIFYRLSGTSNDWKLLDRKKGLIEFESLSPNTYELSIKTVWHGQESSPLSYQFTILKPYWQRWWFYALAILTISFILWLFYKRRLTAQRRKNELINELQASKLTAIQSQMNPHFIFNALNSIQALVLRGDVDNSYNYINQFSDLVRKTLNYSDKDLIDFESEIKLIEIYLSLELLRFGDKFEYQILPPDEVDFLVPPMLIQPFIENALIHGLLHKKGQKKLKLEFELKETVLHCTVTDNGIGRKASKMINQRGNTNHESFAIQAIENRLNILKKRFKHSIGFEYDDLIDGEKVTGTKVTLRIPIIQHQF